MSVTPGERGSAHGPGLPATVGTRRQLLEPVCASALTRCRRRSGAVDGYSRVGRQPFAAGRRSVAVSDRALEDFLAGRLPADLLTATLIHELGHHATRAGYYGLLRCPSRLAFRLVVRVTLLAFGGRKAGGVCALVLAVGGAVAIVQAAQRRQWLSAVVLSAVAFALVGTPLLDGLVSRASEHAADRHAVAVGAGPDLARALQAMARPFVSHGGVSARILDRHPSVGSRLGRLRGPASAARRTSVARPSIERSSASVA